MCNEQLFLFGKSEQPLQPEMKTEAENNGMISLVSESLKENFDTYDIPFIGCDFGTVYPEVFSIIPLEQFCFDEFETETAIMCEIVCASICHQINWDFLREAVLKYTRKNQRRLVASDLQCIESEDVLGMLGNYRKKENIKADERTKMLRTLGDWASKYNRISDVFLEKGKKLKPANKIKNTLLKCSVFSTDPEEKKLNLLLQKLDLIPLLKGIGEYAKPAIDYHLLRLYLRRGLIYARTKYAYDYINNPAVSRKENTVAALRELCSKLLSQISLYTHLSITSVNLVEWHVARSVCDRDNPDCHLMGKEAQWLKPCFNECPFSATCTARNSLSSKLLDVKEPSYKGTSY